MLGVPRSRQCTARRNILLSPALRPHAKCALQVERSVDLGSALPASERVSRAAVIAYVAKYYSGMPFQVGAACACMGSVCAHVRVGG